MSNRIREIRIFDARLNPAEAELGISLIPEQLDPSTDVRGRLMGPRCRYATTVEVAYPVREIVRKADADPPRLVARVIIPEPSFWSPECPFLYHGPVELWEQGRRIDQVEVTHGLRDLALGRRGLRLNGRPLPIRGVARETVTEQEATQLRATGYNTLLTTAGADVWDEADRSGYLVLCRLKEHEDVSRALAEGARPSSLGWVLGPDLLADPLVTAALPSPAPRGQLLGIQLDQPPAGPLSERIAFILCDAHRLAALADVELPKLVLLPEESAPEQSPADLSSVPDLLGWIHQPH
jgi:hypothetical protein